MNINGQIFIINELCELATISQHKIWMHKILVSFCQEQEVTQTVVFTMVKDRWCASRLLVT
ncbi:hypothetical protein JS84_05555 [Vibrio vulnificus]|nr:hypothetical protein Y702_04095 [Vibrio vulnificus BAA87]KFK60426.1 hypothetical protein JS83_08405 [Vibrio vulnificus]KFK65583.1 hypothetical protein JS84_05555 [Vibrio vulnificus]KFK70304.1 hypothetical protein JS85_04575 [Vibrio vulnificus]POC47235.1 hypothetical protein CRN45_17670 [Vibrio vulnificus]